MTARDTFTDEEWALVSDAPLLASFAVTLADPGGLVGSMQEATALATALGEARQAAPGASLIGAVALACTAPEGRAHLRGLADEIVTPGDQAYSAHTAVERLGRAMRLVEAKLPEEAEVFRAWIAEIAQDVAEAAREGGFLGFGGVQVSDAERATLDDIARALSPPAAA